MIRTFNIFRYKDAFYSNKSKTGERNNTSAATNFCFQRNFSISKPNNKLTDLWDKSLQLFRLNLTPDELVNQKKKKKKLSKAARPAKEKQ